MAIKIKHNGAWVTIPTGGENVISIEYSALKDLADAGNLIKGQEYQITNFCTTVIDATDSRFVSAAIPYNVIVYAQTSKKLGMYAKAVAASEESTYGFKDCALDKWILKYDLGGNYNWVSADGGVTLPTGFTGTVYYMCDEYGNEAPYDFKNVKFKATDNTYTGATIGVIYYDPTRDVTYNDGTTDVTLVAVSSTMFSGTSKMGFFDATNKKIKTASFVFTNEWTISEVATDYSYIKANNKKWERVAAKDMDFSAYSGGNTYYAWVDDDANYAYTTVDEPAATTDKAWNTISSATLADGEDVTQTATYTNKGFTFMVNDNPNEDLTLTGRAKNNVIKGNSDKSFPFIAIDTAVEDGVVKNNFFAKDSNNILIAVQNLNRFKFKGNQYLYIYGIGTSIPTVAENYTFVNEFGGTSTETKVFMPTTDLATEYLVGLNDNGDTVTKNILSAAQNFYQRNEPLDANEGDLWFTIED